jgi:hypothetical protein
VNEFCNLLDRIIEDNKIDAIIFYNADETGLTTFRGNREECYRGREGLKFVLFQVGTREYLQQPSVLSALPAAMYHLCSYTNGQGDVTTSKMRPHQALFTHSTQKALHLQRTFPKVIDTFC